MFGFWVNLSFLLFLRYFVNFTFIFICFVLYFFVVFNICFKMINCSIIFSSYFYGLKNCNGKSKTYFPLRIALAIAYRFLDTCYYLIWVSLITIQIVHLFMVPYYWPSLFLLLWIFSFDSHFSYFFYLDTNFLCRYISILFGFLSPIVLFFLIWMLFYFH